MAVFSLTEWENQWQKVEDEKFTKSSEIDFQSRYYLPRHTCQSSQDTISFGFFHFCFSDYLSFDCHLHFLLPALVWSCLVCLYLYPTLVSFLSFWFLKPLISLDWTTLWVCFHNFRIWFTLMKMSLCARLALSQSINAFP